MSSADANRAAVRDAFAAWEVGAGSVFDLLADDATWYSRKAAEIIARGQADAAAVKAILLERLGVAV